jgi:hypothetical protein
LNCQHDKCNTILALQVFDEYGEEMQVAEEAELSQMLASVV